MEKIKGDSVTSSKEVLPILSSMAVDKGLRKTRRGRRDGIHESLKEREERETTGDADTVQSPRSFRSSLVEFKQFAVKQRSVNADSGEDVCDS